MKTWPRIPIDQCQHKVDQMTPDCAVATVIAPKGHVVDPPAPPATPSTALGFATRVLTGVLWFTVGMATGAWLVA